MCGGESENREDYRGDEGPIGAKVEGGAVGGVYWTASVWGFYVG